MSEFTVLGAGGFIGQALTTHLRAGGHDVFSPDRNVPPDNLVTQLHGHVVYCIGLTADFRSRPWDTVDAHIGLLRILLESATFTSFNYISSTRVYLGNKNTKEDTTLIVHPSSSDQLYNISKLMGESLCHVADRPNRRVRVLRLSNVVGGNLRSDNFIYALCREALNTGLIRLRSSLDSAKDYIALADAIRLIEQVSRHGQEHIYNVASGHLVTHREVVTMITALTGACVEVAKNATVEIFPRIDVDRVRDEFQFSAEPPLGKLRELLSTL